ncbi:MAG: hypothetical protein L6R39_001030 [Caloplaca ligustica]|nr:MAG: hypothetical protein L6R39_001030 [Caloplaca ligustica]
MVKKWKSSLVSPKKGQQQARRDGAAAMDTTYPFFKHAYPDREPSAALICVFFLCVNQQGFEYRVHWRRVDGDGSVSWGQTLLHAPDWVRGARLTAIRDALKVLAMRPPPPMLTSVPSQPHPLTPPVTTGRAAGSPAAGSPAHKRMRRMPASNEADNDEDELA